VGVHVNESGLERLTVEPAESPGLDQVSTFGTVILVLNAPAPPLELPLPAKLKLPGCKY
jgi:hypothetical protein